MTERGPINPLTPMFRSFNHGTALMFRPLPICLGLLLSPKVVTYRCHLGERNTLVAPPTHPGISSSC